GFVARKQLDGLLKCYNSLLELTLSAGREAKVPVGLSRVRVDLDGPSQFGLGCRQIILFEGQRAQRPVKRLIARLEMNPFPKLSGGVLELSRCPVQFT